VDEKPVLFINLALLFITSIGKFLNLLTKYVLGSLNKPLKLVFFKDLK